MRLMNFWLGNLAWKLISHFRGGQEQITAADRCVQGTGRRCQQGQGLPKTAVFPVASHSALLAAGRSWSWPQKKTTSPLLQPPCPPLDLFSDLAPCKVELSKSLLLSLSSVALPSSPILTLVALSSTVSPRHTNHQGANFQRCEHAFPRAITQVSSRDWRTLSDAYIVC